jgi:glutamate-1-semialdehyde 2,1-aminomutase
MGRPSCLVFGTKDHEGQPSQAFRTLFIQEMLRRGVLGQSLVISSAHSDEDIELTVEAARGAMGVYARAVDQGSTEGLLHGRPVAPAMREFAAPRRLPDTRED